MTSGHTEKRGSFINQKANWISSIDDDLRKAAGLKYKKKKELPEDYKKLKGEIYSVFSSKNRSNAEYQKQIIF